ncbi:MAG: hypothetical protein CL678_16730 [Bdellovibrionaceae bacterium]|nr:hypothetical protein [Pseudobdellovibrionaceae bacterium]
MLAVAAISLTLAYSPLDQTRLDCDLAPAQYGSVPGTVSVPGYAVEVYGNSTAIPGERYYDPIVFAHVGEVIVCAGHLYVDGGAPRFCTAGDISGVWFCPDPTDSSKCWTQTATSTKLLQYHDHHSVVWPRQEQVAITFDTPEAFSDIQGMLACAALLAVALALKASVHIKLALNWACAIVPFVATQHAVVMQPPWTLALLTAAATAIAIKMFYAKTAATAERQLKPLLMAAIAIALPHRAIGIHATLLTRLVIGLGIGVVTGARPSVSNALLALWATAVLIRPIVIIALIASSESLVVELKTAAVGGTAIVTGHLARHTLLVSNRK